MSNSIIGNDLKVSFVIDFNNKNYETTYLSVHKDLNEAEQEVANLKEKGDKPNATTLNKTINLVELLDKKNLSPSEEMIINSNQFPEIDEWCLNQARKINEEKTIKFPQKRPKR